MNKISYTQIDIINSRSAAKIGDRYIDEKGNVWFGTTGGKLIIPPSEIVGLEYIDATKLLPPSSIIPIHFVAAEDIPPFVLVTTGGEVANSSNITHKNRLLGLSYSYVRKGFSGKAINSGRITNSAWRWQPKDLIFLNGLSLSKINVTTGFSVVLGSAVTQDTINVSIQPSILL